MSMMEPFVLARGCALEDMSAELLSVMPCLSSVQVLRQWAGPYDVSPGWPSILGEPDGIPGFTWSAAVGHGFMMAPVIARYYAELLCGGARHPVFDRCRLSRFKDGSTEKEVMIIG